MSTYAIASAIEKFANNFKEVINEKNKIEREKLEFEKEKFEFNKQQLELNNKNTKLGSNVDAYCNHNWRYESTTYIPSAMCNVRRYVCVYCGETKIEEEDV